MSECMAQARKPGGVSILDIAAAEDDRPKQRAKVANVIELARDVRKDEFE